jgi:hypothetical protein
MGRVQGGREGARLAELADALRAARFGVHWLLPEAGRRQQGAAPASRAVDGLNPVSRRAEPPMG